VLWAGPPIPHARGAELGGKKRRSRIKIRKRIKSRSKSKTDPPLSFPPGAAGKS
jgi:hypothetical protein